MTDRISGGAFKQMVAFGAACIAQQKQTINGLNAVSYTHLPSGGCCHRGTPR